MTETEALQQIVKIVSQILEDKGADVPAITANTELLSGQLAIDSLDLAMMVSELEGVMGHDPFARGFIEFRTAGELAKLYAA
jgi:acyl carrier protein